MTFHEDFFLLRAFRTAPKYTIVRRRGTEQRGGMCARPQTSADQNTSDPGKLHLIASRGRFPVMPNQGCHISDGPMVIRHGGPVRLVRQDTVAFVKLDGPSRSIPA